MNSSTNISAVAHELQPRRPLRRPAAGRVHRGVAMLMVMIALVVCMVLVTGYLSTQGTANGIARNESEYVRAQRAAESGVNMCLWLMRTRSDWRSTMNPGTWLSNVAVGSSRVTVTAADAAGNTNFLADPTVAVVFTSTGTYRDRTAKLVATAQPTGAGTVFGGGTFIVQQLQLQNDALVDSYSSANGPYSFFTSGSSAILATASSAAGALSLQDSADVFGSFTAGPNAASGVVTAESSAIAPQTVAVASELRTPGEVIPPNTVGLASRGVFNNSGLSMGGPLPGQTPGFTVSRSSGWPTVTMNYTGLYHVTGDFAVNEFTTLAIAASRDVTVYVNGNVTINGTVSLNSNARLTIFYNGNFTASNNAQMGSSANTGSLTVLGTKNAGTMMLRGNARFSGGVFAPQSALALQGTSEFHGAAVAKILAMQDFAKLHWDDNLKSKSISNVTNGSAPPGTPIYQIKYQWN